MHPMNTPQDEHAVLGTGPDSGPPPPPLLVIDWGVEPQAGKHLSPEFHLVAPGYRARPRVTAILDRHLDQEAWNTNPSPNERGASHWSFHQSLELTRGGEVCRSGQFLLELQVVFPEPGPGGIQCYRAVVRVTVPNASESANPILEIRAKDSSLVNLQGLDINRYAKIVVEGSERSVVNVLHSDGAQPSTLGPAPANEKLIVQLPLEAYRELQQLIPCGSARRSAPRMDAASLVFDDGRCIHLLARESIVMGRDSSGPTPSDIRLRLLPLDDDRWKVSKLISRQHVRLALCPEGLRLEDCRSGLALGTYLGGQRLTTPRTISPPVSWWPQRHAVDVAGVLGLDLTLHHDRGWDDWAQCSDTGALHYAAAAGCGVPPLWHLACQSRIDAVRVCRRVQLPVADYLDRIKQVLMPTYSEQWEKVSRSAAAIERIDKLAEREQYVFIYRTAEIGGADEAAIRISSMGPNNIPARILNLGGGFWLEGLMPETATFVNGQPVAKRELVPLAPGDRLSFGVMELTFQEFGQIRM